MIGPRFLQSKHARRLLLLLGCLAALAVAWFRFRNFDLTGFPPIGGNDFVVYWSGARLALQGLNPNDGAAVWSMVRAVGGPVSGEGPLLLMPWILALVLPVAPLPITPAALVWLLLQLGLLLGSGLALWGYFAPGDNRHWIGLVLAITFFPGIVALRIGQMSPWVLAGVVGFLWAQRQRRDLLAGCALALLLTKPNVAYLFLLAALWWIWRTRRWWVLAGWLGALVASVAILFLFIPNAFGTYLMSMQGADRPLDWASPTLGSWLRVLFGLERGWLQFVPLLVGLLGLGLWLLRRRGPWRWQETASPLLLASALTTPYGWSYDQVVLLPVVIDLVARLRFASLARRVVLLGALAASQAALWALNRLYVSDIFYVWHVPVLTVIYLLAPRHAPADTVLQYGGKR